MAHEAAVYVYGIVAASDRGRTSASGVNGSGVRTVGHANLAALVSDVEVGPLAAAREVRAHWRVLQEASENATVLPLRFGTVMESDEAVREQLLAPNEERLEGLLQELAGRVQLTVKGDYDEERLLRDVVRDSPEITTLRERVRTLPDAAGYYERIKLGELVAAGVARRKEEDEKLALARLEPAAVAARVEATAGSQAAFNIACLVERDSVGAFSKAVGELGEELGERVRIRYVGPQPLFSFAEADLVAGGGRWA